MRILFLLTQDLESPSGLGRYWPLARELVGRGHSVTVAALHSNFKTLPLKRFEREGVVVWYVAPMHVRKEGNIKDYYSSVGLLWIATQATLALIRAAIEVSADIVHVGKPHPMNGLAGLAAKYLRGRPLVVDCDDYEAATNQFSGKWQQAIVAWFEDHIPRLADSVTTHASFLRQRLLSLGIAAERIAYLPNGVDFERFGAVDEGELAALRASLGLQGKRVVAFVGTLTEKAHPLSLLLEGFRQVVQQIPTAVLLIVGGGNDYERLQEQAGELGISAATLFCGRVPPQQVKYYYRLAEVSVDPVYDDDVARARFPIKLFESWVCGVPFVTADVGDRRLLLENPRAGLLAQAGDASSMAQAIVQVLQDAALAEEIRRNGLERAKEFDWRRIAQNMENLYLRRVG